MPRRLGTLGAIILLGALVVVRPLPAVAASGRFADPEDTTTPLDIATVSHDSDTSRVTYTAATYDGWQPSQVGAFLWAIDTTGDQVPDYFVGAAWDGTKLAAEVDDGAGNQLAPASVSQTISTTIVVSFDRRDIRSPIAYSYRVASWFDTNGNGQIEAGEVDFAGPVDDGRAVDRLSGADRIGTAIEVSSADYDDGQASAVVLARSDTYPDALAGTPLAARKDAPLLLTPPAQLDERTGNEIRRVLPSGGTVYLLGGPSAISDAVAAQVGALGYQVQRFAGPTRYDTALDIASRGLGDPQTLLLTTGVNFPDALSAGAAAAAKDAAVLLTSGSTMPPAVATYLAAHGGAARYAIGGPAAQADPGATAIVGGDRYDTSARVAAAFFGSDPAAAGLASGVSFPDALAGGVDIAGAGGPLLLTSPEGLAPPVTAYLGAHRTSISAAVIYGGTAAVPESVRTEVLTDLN
ncbi:MAG: cell wall-binding repeat-containing protein [Actinobacteria bacterium]|nr:MAG: cell wall-binding repeat-containing protein [Actinomycetota bacterium]